jgi:hypothetical protein
MECSTNNDSNSLIDFPESLSAQEVQHFDNILRSIQQCSQEQNIDRKIQILRFINSVLPNEIQLRIPSLITDDYVESALYNLEMACKGLTKLKKLFSLCIMNMFKTTRLEEMLGKRQRTFFWLNLHIHAT